MTDSRRTAYNKLKYDAIRQQREAIQAFKAANPERFAALLKKVEKDVAIPAPFTPLAPISAASSNRVKEIITEIADGRKDYFICTDAHTYFEMLYGTTAEEAAAKVNERWNTTYLPENIKRIEKCSCPACV